MNGSLSTRVIWIAALTAVAAGSITAIDAALELKDRSEKLRACVRNIQELEALRRASGRDEAAIRIFEQLPNPHPPSVPKLLKETLPSEKYETREQPSQATAPGWMVRRSEVSFAQIELKKLAHFLETAESQRPPWRLTACTIRSLPAPGSAQVTLVLEALDAVPPSAPAGRTSD